MIKWLHGYVQLQFSGMELIKIIRLFAQHRIDFRDILMIQHPEEDELPCMQLKIKLSHFFQMRRLLRGTHCRVRIISRHGLPFYIDKLYSRKVFVIAGAGCIIALWLCSSMIWKISIVGNERIHTHHILEAAARQGIHLYQWKFRLGQVEQLAKGIQQLLPETSWIGVEIHGTHLRIQVVESALSSKSKLENPCHIVARKSALVTHMLTYQGKPIVEPHTYVRQGDILISGVLGNRDPSENDTQIEGNTDNRSENHPQLVVAQGEVRGIVWYIATIESALHKVYDVFTGSQVKRYYLAFGNRAYQLYGKKQLPYANYVSSAVEKVWSWREHRFPLRWIVETIRESDRFEQQLDSKQAAQLGILQAKQRLLQQIDEQALVVNEKILHEKTENGKVYMKVLFEVEESITQIQPIVTQGD
jgi:similar to stage IV sporulation protein